MKYHLPITAKTPTFMNYSLLRMLNCDSKDENKDWRIKQALCGLLRATNDSTVVLCFQEDRTWGRSGSTVGKLVWMVGGRVCVGRTQIDGSIVRVESFASDALWEKMGM